MPGTDASIHLARSGEISVETLILKGLISSCSRPPQKADDVKDKVKSAVEDLPRG
jgi:hypothetical protein